VNSERPARERRGAQAARPRGRLKIFFGAAPGVGKTHAMLAAACELRAAGTDVVAGHVETRGRPELDALVAALEILPPRWGEAPGPPARELDLDAAIARHPAVILVDELAHANASGGRHAKRWQEVAELLAAGVDVWTTLDVQHLESLADVVTQITGLPVGETVPDSFFAGADEVELVDLSPDDLLARERDGKVPAPDLAGPVRERFFRRGNLIALRELALRQVADHVDAELRGYMREHAVPRTWPVRERLLVAIGPSPHSARLVRAGKRMADRLGAEWIAVYVETPAMLRLPRDARDRIVQHLRLAEQLGGEALTLSGSRVTDEILACARGRNVTKIVVGKPARARWRRLLRGSIVDAIVEGSGEIDVYVIREDPSEARPSRLAAARPRRGALRRYGCALAVVAGCTGVAWPAYGRFEPANLVMVYLLGVVAVAIRLGPGPSVLAALLSVAAFDFFFVPPHLTLAVDDAQYLVTLAVLSTVALVISRLTGALRTRVDEARAREQRTGALYRLSRELAGTREVGELLRIALRHVAEGVPGDAAILLPDATDRVTRQAAEPPEFDLDERERAVAQWAFAHNQLAGRGTATLAGAGALYLPLSASQGAVGVLALRPADPRALDAPEQLHYLGTFASQIALAIERAILAERAHQAQLTMEAERLRNALLSAVSHDLRTPLAGIRGAATGLVTGGEALDAVTRAELAESIADEAERLDRLLGNLLDMTRLEAGVVQPKREWHPLEEIVGAALARLAAPLRDRPVQVSIPADLPLVCIDGMLIEQVLINLLENALRYTPAGSPIEISATAGEAQVTVEVADRGAGLLPGEAERIFEKFRRGTGGRAEGTGLGLTICRGFVAAHGGRIWAENRPGGGARFRFDLPIDQAPPRMTLDDE
jgi:two-component system sensor histidine kinase KdpD